MGQPKKVLIIDDEELALQSLHDLLVGSGYETRLAKNGLTAIALFQSWQPDLVLLDLVMPEIDGFAVCQSLRNLPGGKHIPILIVTMSDDAESISRAFEVGASDVIFKPVNEQLFLHRVMNHLSLSSYLQRLENDMKKHRNVLRMSGLGCWEWNIGANRLVMSEEMRQVLAVGAHELVMTYQNFMQFIHPDDRARVDLCFWQSLREKNPFTIEHRVIRKDGRQVIVVHQGEVVTDDYGNPWGLFGIIQDLSDRKEYEEKLHLLKQSIEVLPVGVTISDLDGKILYVNHVEALMHGYQPEELIGSNAGGMAPERLRKKILLEQFEKTGTWKRESVNVRKDGTEFPVQLASILVRGADGQPIGIVTSCEEITERKIIEQEIEKKAFFDGLTGLPNRNMFNDRLFNALVEAKRDKSRLAILFMDMDGLKLVNDTYGHETGDDLLKQFSKRISHRMRDADTFARFGGDEFVLLIKSREHPMEAATKAADRILSSLRDPFKVDGRSINCMVSIGISFYPENGKLPEQLVHCADMAMYRAKSEGGSRYVLASESSPAENRFDESLKLAFERNDIVLLCQPEIDVASGALVGAELLPSWNCPKLGAVNTLDDWQPIADDRLCKLTDWMLGELTSCVHDTRKQMSDDFTFSFPLQFVAYRDDSFLGEFRQFASRTGLANEQLEFDVKFSLLQKRGDLTPVIREMKETGFKVCISGGSDYVPVSRFVNTELVDKVKLDIEGIESHPRNSGVLTYLRNHYRVAGHGQLKLPGPETETPDRQVVRSGYQRMFDTVYLNRKLEVRNLFRNFVQPQAKGGKRDYPSNIHYF